MADGEIESIKRMLLMMDSLNSKNKEISDDIKILIRKWKLLSIIEKIKSDV